MRDLKRDVVGKKMNESFDVRMLVENADAAIANVGLSSEPKRTALVGLAFCDLLVNAMNESQQRAVQAAHQFWEKGDPDGHQKWVKRFAQITDFDQRNKINGNDAAINRLVWTALNTNTEFNGYACEYLINLGAEAGLAAAQMKNILSRYIPGL
jgi:hypothetical protein